MAEIFQKLRFDDRDIERSMKLMLRGMDDVRKKAKEVSVFLETEFAKSMKKNVQQTQSFGQQFKQGLLGPLQFLSVAGIAAGITQLGIESVKTAIDLEKIYFQIGNITNATEEEIALFKGAIPALSTQVGIMQTELAKGLYQINSAGITGKQALDVLTFAAQAAAVGLGDVNQVARTLTTIINAYGKGNITALRASNALFQAIKSGSGDVDQIAPAFTKATTLAAEFGIEIEQVSAEVSQLTNKGVPAAEAMTQIQSIMVALLKPTAEGQKRLAALNLDYEELRKLAGIDLAKALQFLREKFEGNAEAISDVFGRSEALQAFYSLTGANAKELAKILHDAKTENEGLARSFDKLQETSSQKWNRMWTSIKTATTEGSNYVIDVVSWMFDQWDIFLTGIDSRTRRMIELAKKINLETANKNAPSNPLFNPLLDQSTKDKPVFFDPNDTKAEFDEAAADALASKVRLDEEAKRKLEALREEYKKLLDDFAHKAAQVDIEGIVNPFEKLKATRQLGLDEINKLREAIIQKAKESGKPVSKDLEAFVKKLTDGVDRVYFESLDELNKKIKASNQDIANQTAQSQIEQIKNPFDKLAAIRDQGIKDIAEFRANAIETAKAEGIPVAEGLEDYIKSLTDGVEDAFKTGLRDLNKKLKDEAENLKKQTAQAVIDVISNPLDRLAAQKAQDIKEIISFRDAEIERAKAEARPVWEGLEQWVAAQLALIEAKFNKDVDAENDKAGKKNVLAKLLGIEDEEFNEISKQFAKAYSAINDLIGAGIQGQIDDNNRLIESIQERLGAAQDALAQEEELQREGSANNVASKKRELEAIKKEEAIAVAKGNELKKQALKQQLIADSLQQVSSLTTAGIKIFEANAGIPIVGLITAAASIATLFALVARFKNQVRALSSPARAYKGGAIADYDHGFVNIQGRTDKNGGRGHRVEDSNLVLGGKEFITNEVTAMKHAEFLEDLNMGKYDHIHIPSVIENRAKLTELLRTDFHIDGKRELKTLRKLEAKARETEFITKKEFKKMFDDHAKEIRQSIKEIPVIVPETKDTIGFRKYTPNLRERIIFEENLKSK